MVFVSSESSFRCSVRGVRDPASTSEAYLIRSIKISTHFNSEKTLTLIAYNRFEDVFLDSVLNSHFLFALPIVYHGV